MVQPGGNSGDSGGAGILQQGEVLRRVPDAADLCRTFPHTSAHTCAYCAAHPGTDADAFTERHSDYPPDARAPHARRVRTKARRRARIRHIQSSGGE